MEEKDIVTVEPTEVVSSTPKPYALQLLEHGVNTDQLKELLMIQKEVDAMEARKAFYADMAKAQADMPAAPEDKHNDRTRSPYASYKVLAATCKPIYTKHGISSPTVLL